MRVVEACSGVELTDTSDPSRILIRQVLGAVAEYNKREIVGKLAKARARIRGAEGRCEGRKPFGTREGEAATIARIVKLRGIPVDRYSEEDLKRLYFAIGTHVGTPVFQNRSGELMRAIRDEGAHVGRTYGETKDEKGSTFLSSYARTLTNGGLRFHTDRTDVVGLLCVRQARAGGTSGTTVLVCHESAADEGDT